MSTKRLDSLGRMAYHNVTIPVFCRDCHRYAEIEPSSLILRYGWAAEPEHLPWRCSGCGATEQRVWVGRPARLAQSRLGGA